MPKFKVGDVVIFITPSGKKMDTIAYAYEEKDYWYYGFKVYNRDIVKETLIFFCK